jgi:hypothetical protein
MAVGMDITGFSFDQNREPATISRRHRRLPCPVELFGRAGGKQSSQRGRSVAILSRQDRNGGAGPQDSIRQNAEQSISIQEEKFEKENYFYFQSIYIY